MHFKGLQIQGFNDQPKIRNLIFSFFSSKIASYMAKEASFRLFILGRDGAISKAGFRIRIQSGSANPDPDPGEQKLPTKVEENYEISCFEVLLDVL
jgi:hypothetical protein